MGAPLWMTTYGDMMTLLLCFFILLFSFSTIDVVKFRDVIIELQGALGVLTGGPMVLNLGDIPQKQIAENPAASTRQMHALQQRIEDKVAEENLESSVETTIDERGLMIRFTDTVLFDLGRADIKPEAWPILETVSEEIAEISNRIQIEGHTDPTPINTFQFPSNWELSTARATAIVHYFVERGNIEPPRLSAAGYSYYHPVAPNNTADNRTRNRRVDVIILKTDEDAALGRREDALEFLESTASDGIVVEVTGEESTLERRQEALEFLESPDSDGIVVEVSGEDTKEVAEEDTDDTSEEEPSEVTEDEEISDAASESGESEEASEEVSDSSDTGQNEDSGQEE